MTTVHLLLPTGKPLCGFTDDHVDKWVDGNQWVPIGEYKDVVGRLPKDDGFCLKCVVKQKGRTIAKLIPGVEGRMPDSAVDDLGHRHFARDPTKDEWFAEAYAFADRKEWEDAYKSLFQGLFKARTMYGSIDPKTIPDRDKRAVFAMGRTADNGAMVIFGIPRANFDYMMNTPAECTDFDFTSAGLRLRVAMFARETHDECMDRLKELAEQANAGLQDARDKDFSIKGPAVDGGHRRKPQ